MKHSFQVVDTDLGHEGTVILWGDLTIEHALGIKTVLQDAITQADRIRLILEDIVSIDISFLQLLCATHRECFKLEKHISFQEDPGDIIAGFLKKAGFCLPLGCRDDEVETCFLKGICSQ